MTYLLDTNVVSELRRDACDQRVASWFGRIDSIDLHLSVLVVGEVRQGIERLRRRGDNRQADVFERFLQRLRAEYSERLLDVSAAVAERWGALNAVQPLPVVDGLMAATAIEHDLTFVTRDRGATVPGLRLLNPWAT